MPVGNMEITSAAKNQREPRSKLSNFLFILGNAFSTALSVSRSLLLGRFLTSEIRPGYFPRKRLLNLGRPDLAQRGSAPQTHVAVPIVFLKIFQRTHHTLHRWLPPRQGNRRRICRDHLHVSIS